MNTVVEEHFKKVTDRPITKIIDYQLDIKLGKFTQEQPTIVLKKLKTEIPLKVWKTKKFNDLLH